MRKTALRLAMSLSLVTTATLMADTEEQTKITQTPFEAFTGKITRNKVRMRLQPNIDCPIVKEMDRDYMLIVVGEDDDFYAVEPPLDTKSYVYRTLVLDGVIEGNRVNVRLEPSIESPVIAQLNTGERVDGKVCSLNSRWQEIFPPKSTRFYVCKDYVEKIGDPNMMARMDKRRSEVNELLNDAYLQSQSELQKSFEQIQLDQVYADFKRVLDDYSDFPEQTGRAQDLLIATQEGYLQKKIAYLEAKTQSVSSAWTQEEIALTLESIEEKAKPAQQSFEWEKHPTAVERSMGAWAATEEALFKNWSKENGGTQRDFYRNQENNAVTMQGIIQLYSRQIKNKPGDYVLVSQSSRTPIAYLYSTTVNLKDYVGNVATIQVAPRTNNNFAFPAYFVLEIN